MNRTLSLFIMPCALALAHVTSAQVQSDIVDALNRQQSLEQRLAQEEDEEYEIIPELYEGELEDIGPQYLLLETAKHKWVGFMADYQLYRTSNANLFEDDTGDTDVMVFTIQATIHPYETTVFDGSFKTQIGYRYQMFRYGVLSGPSKVINGSVVELNDFQNRMPFGEVSFSKGHFYSRVGFRYSQLFDRETAQDFYEEYVPYWSIGYEWTLDDKSGLYLQYEGNLRFTKSDSLGFFPDSWNDRIDTAISLTYSRVLSQRWVAQASYFFQYGRYTHKDRERNDYYNALNGRLAYYISNNVNVGLTTSYEFRESSEAVTADYENWNIGGSANVAIRF